MWIYTVDRVSTLTFDELLAGARCHANAALTAYSNQDERSILFNAAISMEQLSKALLFSHPALLAEVNNGKFDSLLHLTGFGQKADKLSAPKTVGAKVAILRVRQVIDVKAPKAALDQLIDVRDGVLHAGLLNAKSTRELLTAFLRYSEEIYEALEERQAWRESRWGEWAQLVASLITQPLSEVGCEVTRKITAARRRYLQLMDQIPPDERSTVRVARLLHAGQSGLMARSFRSAICPACGNTNAWEAGDALLSHREIHESLCRRTGSCAEPGTGKRAELISVSVAVLVGWW